jgi:hypothetical protein
MIMNNVVSMSRYKAEKQYQQYSTDCSLNLALDTVTYKHTQPRDIAKEMVKSYLKLLSK